jgi:hypothetical protein
VTPEPDEFDKTLAVLCAGFNVPCTEDRQRAYGKAFRKIPPAGWERLVDYCLGEEGPERMPSVRELWRARSEMRARAPADRPPSVEIPWHGDQWDAAANRHLLAHIMRTLRANPQHYGESPSYHAMRNTNTKNADASPGFIANIARLLAAKKAWAADMRDMAPHTGGLVDGLLQREIWADYITKAEAISA